ncbi:MAG: glycosyltransferase family A protein [Erythrobacter sp.]|uniref:glycosyltransferase family 2 protein n=1 Tax=Erythrobacter sp. TaxID=1042 RepID=UPI0032ECC849
MSVIIPTFNRAVLVAEALASLEKLRWKDVEVILVDDGSTDDTEAVIANIRSGGFRWPLEYIWQPNAGPAAARNAGRRLACGEFLYHLDSDDLVAPAAFDELIAAMLRAGTTYAVGIVEDTDREGARSADQPFSSHHIVPGDILASNWYTHAAIYRREVIDRIDGYNEALRTGEDTEMHWRIMATAGWPALHQGLVAARRFHDFGQLGKKDQTRSEQLHAIVQVYEHFFEACPEHFCTGQNVFRLLNMGMQSGLIRDLETKGRCHSMLVRMAGMGASLPAVHLLSLMLKPDSVTYYQGLVRVWHALRTIRRQIRPEAPKAMQTSDERLSHKTPAVQAQKDPL